MQHTDKKHSANSCMLKWIFSVLHVSEVDLYSGYVFFVWTSLFKLRALCILQMKNDIKNIKVSLFRNLAICQLIMIYKESEINNINKIR